MGNTPWWKVHRGLKLKLLCGPAIPLWGIYLKGLRWGSWKAISFLMYSGTLSTVAKTKYHVCWQVTGKIKYSIHAAQWNQHPEREKPWTYDKVGMMSGRRCTQQNSESHKHKIYQIPLLWGTENSPTPRIREQNAGCQGWRRGHGWPVSDKMLLTPACGSSRVLL